MHITTTMIKFIYDLNNIAKPNQNYSTLIQPYRTNLSQLNFKIRILKKCILNYSTKKIFYISLDIKTSRTNLYSKIFQLFSCIVEIKLDVYFHQITLNIKPKEMVGNTEEQLYTSHVTFKTMVQLNEVKNSTYKVQIGVALKARIIRLLYKWHLYIYLKYY